MKGDIAYLEERADRFLNIGPIKNALRAAARDGYFAGINHNHGIILN